MLTENQENAHLYQVHTQNCIHMVLNLDRICSAIIKSHPMRSNVLKTDLDKSLPSIQEIQTALGKLRQICVIGEQSPLPAFTLRFSACPDFPEQEFKIQRGFKCLASSPGPVFSYFWCSSTALHISVVFLFLTHLIKLMNMIINYNNLIISSGFILKLCMKKALLIHGLHIYAPVPCAN